MTDRLAALYPPAAYRQQVVTSMPIGRLPHALPIEGRNLVTPTEWYGPALFQEIEVRGSRIGFVEKAFPHSMHDLMILASDEEIRCATTDLVPTGKRLIFDLALRFIEFLSDPAVVNRYDLEGGHLHMAWNYDRATVDRDNSMCCEKRFHLHLNYWTSPELADLEPTEWGDIPDLVSRRNLIDPVAYLAELVLRDWLSAHMQPPMRLMPVDPDRDQRLGLPAGPKVELPSWAAASATEFLETLDALHLASDEAYRNLWEAFIGEPYMSVPWHRPRLLPPGQIIENLQSQTWLQADTMAALVTLAEAMRNLDALGIADMRTAEPSALNRVTLAGLDYAFTAFRNGRNTRDNPLTSGGPVYLVMHVKMFANIGGAGLPTIDGIPIVRLDRTRGRILTDEDITKRRSLRHDFLDIAVPAATERFGVRNLYRSTVG